MILIDTNFNTKNVVVCALVSDCIAGGRLSRGRVKMSATLTGLTVGQKTSQIQSPLRSQTSLKASFIMHLKLNTSYCSIGVMSFDVCLEVRGEIIKTVLCCIEYPFIHSFIHIRLIKSLTCRKPYIDKKEHKT